MGKKRADILVKVRFVINKNSTASTYESDWKTLQALVYERSFEFGEFTLSSGKKSKYYFDGKQVTLYPKGAHLVSKIILQKINGLHIDAVGGLTIGADPIVGALAVAADIYNMSNLNLFIVRKTPKGHGTGKLIEGPPLKEGNRVVVVDDVITTGGSVLDAIKAVQEMGCKVVKVIALVDRREGGTEKIQQMGIEVDPIFTINDFISDASI